MLILDVSRAVKKIDRLNDELTGSTLISALESIAQRIAENMKIRLLESEDGNARTQWRDDVELDGFRGSRPGYNRGAREDLAAALTVTPVKLINDGGRKALWVGIGDIDALEEVGLSGPTRKPYAKLWKILEYGTGEFSTHPRAYKHEIVRTGTQRFPVRSARFGGFMPPKGLYGKPVGRYDGSGHLVLPVLTRNPGQAGRHYLFAISGEIYMADLALIQGLSGVIRGAASRSGRR